MDGCVLVERMGGVGTIPLLVCVCVFFFKFSLSVMASIYLFLLVYFVAFYHHLLSRFFLYQSLTGSCFLPPVPSRTPCMIFLFIVPLCFSISSLSHFLHSPSHVFLFPPLLSPQWVSGQRCVCSLCRGLQSTP